MKYSEVSELLDVKTYRTFNYSIFKRIEGNRKIKLSIVNDIIKNIAKSGQIYTVIIVNENMEIIDGQHRVEAFKILHLPVTYQVIHGLTKKDCIALNITSRKWILNDYIDSYKELGREGYSNLNELMEMFPMFSVSTIATIALGLSSQGTPVTNTLKNGDFEMKYSMEEMIEKLNYLSEFHPMIKDLGGYKYIFYLSVSFLVDNNLIERDRFNKQMDKYHIMLKPIVNFSDSVQQIEDIYNYRKADSKKVYFVSQYKNIIKNQ